MVKVWEFSRKPSVIVLPGTPATTVRALLRDREESIAVVVDDERSMKYQGYVTWREVIQITSHYSNLHAKDIALSHPVAYASDEVEDVVKRMEEERVYAVPLLRSVDEEVVVGVVSASDVLKGLLNMGYEAIAETVAEIMTTDNLDKYVTIEDEEITRVWSDFVYRGILGKVVVKSHDDRVPVGIITQRDLVETSRWFFHRESERGLKTVAKVRRIMLRGVPVATADTPVQYVAKVMAENEFTILPVIDPEKGSLVGVVTIYDVVRAYLEGAKPGRVRIPVKIPLPIEVTREERVTYTSTTMLLQQVVTSKPPLEELVGLRVADIARPELPAITVNDTVEHARREMLRRRTNYLLVVDERGEIVGAVTKWSMLRAIGLKGPIWRRRVRDRYFIDYVMETNLPRVPADASLEEVALRMVEDRAEIAIVVDEKGSPIGFVTKDDLVDAYARTETGRAKVENAMTPGRVGIVHPHHSLHHVVKKMQTFYLDALTVYDGSKIVGVVSANRLPFVAFEDSVIGVRSRRLVWVRKLVRGAARRGRYVKVTPLLAIDATVPLQETILSTDDLVKAIEMMKKHNVDGIPVATPDGRVAGVICKNDVIRELARTALRRKELGLTLRIEKEKKEQKSV